MDPHRLSALIEQEALPSSYAAVVSRWWQPLAARIAAEAARAGRGIVVGVNGAQGSGKSTLSLFTAELLRGDYGLNVALLSLDDLYLTRAERVLLAARVHPLLATRGVPGTHDVALGLDLIERALTGVEPLLFPRFDKAQDDRAPIDSWQSITAPVDVVVFEGWCVGARPVPQVLLAEPLNALEAEEDKDGRWRRYVNAQLAGAYRTLFDRIDLGVMVCAPDFDEVAKWRLLQESKLIARTGRGMDEPATRRFIQHYERLTRSMLADLPPTMDVVFDIGANHEPERATGLAGLVLTGQK